MLQVCLSLEIDFHGAFTRIGGEVLGEQEQELMPLCLAHALSDTVSDYKQTE
jgi:hypothetical protein